VVALETTPADVGEEGEEGVLVRTRLGGLFFLVNVAQSLELYGDFTTPLTRGIALDPWDFVTLVGRRLLRRPPADPVWALLAELAGRGNDVPLGRGYAAPRAWRVPPAWLAPFETDGLWRAIVAEDRLRVEHPAGFAVVDVAAGRDPSARLRRELSRYAHAGVLTADAEPRPQATPLERWTDWVTDYVRARLALALRCPPRAVAAGLLRVHAWIDVTSGRVDVRFPLEESRVDVRLAGLDRDPGWVPAAGRILAFHFE
jgi:hypothetical protein